MTAKRFPLSILLVALLSALLYLPTLRYALVWDDADIITNNPLIRSNNPFAYFGKSFWAGGPTTSLGQDPYYRPLTNFTLWLDYHAGNGKPMVFHLHNVLMFSLLTAFLMLLLARLLRSRWAALFGGLLFAVFPLHSEVVSYVSGRTDLLMTLWIVVSAYAFARLTAQLQATAARPLTAIRTPQSNSAGLLGRCLALAFALACFAKETALVFPIVALAWLLLARRRTRLMTGTVIGYFMIALIYLYARFSGAAYPGGLSGAHRTRRPASCPA